MLKKVLPLFLVSFTEVRFTYNKIHWVYRVQVYKPMNFDQWTRWYNHQQDQNTEHFYCPPKFLHGLLQAIPSLLSVSPGNYYSFCYYSLLFLKFHINMNRQYVVFYIYLLSVRGMLLRYIHVVTYISSLFLFRAK